MLISRAFFIAFRRGCRPLRPSLGFLCWLPMTVIFEVALSGHLIDFLHQLWIDHALNRRNPARNTEAK